MLALLYAYLIAPRGFRRALRWLALCLFLLVLVMVVMLFWRVLRKLPNHHGSIFHPKPHQPLSPDFIRFDPSRPYYATKEDL
jgi:hypothetical protein